MINDLVSVIIPVYNVEKYLRHCVDCVLKQSYSQLEVILVDDGSKDSSGQICDELAQKDSRVVVIHSQNGGAAKARNTALDQAQGEYYIFVDSDDYIAPDFIEVLHNVAVKHECDIVQCGYKITGERDYKFNVGAKDSCEVEFESGISYQARFYDDRRSGAYVFWNKIYHRDIWKRLRIPEGMICEDEAILHEVYYRAKRIAVIPDELYAYFETEQSVMRGTYSLKQLDIVKALKMRFQFYKEHGLELYQSQLSYMICRVALVQFNQIKKNCPKQYEIQKKLLKDYKSFLPHVLKSEAFSGWVKFEFIVYRFFPMCYPEFRKKLDKLRAMKKLGA